MEDEIYEITVCKDGRMDIKTYYTPHIPTVTQKIDKWYYTMPDTNYFTDNALYAFNQIYNKVLTESPETEITIEFSKELEFSEKQIIADQLMHNTIEYSKRGRKPAKGFSSFVAGVTYENDPTRMTFSVPELISTSFYDYAKRNKKDKYEMLDVAIAIAEGFKEFNLRRGI